MLDVVLIQYPLPATAVKVEPVTIVCQVIPLSGNASKTGGEPAPVDVNTCPSFPVATATGSPEAS